MLDPQMPNWNCRQPFLTNAARMACRSFRQRTARTGIRDRIRRQARIINPKAEGPFSTPPRVQVSTRSANLLARSPALLAWFPQSSMEHQRRRPGRDESRKSTVHSGLAHSRTRSS